MAHLVELILKILLHLIVLLLNKNLKEILDIPVFHDDQHGTAIITTAALINALDISKKKISEVKIVVNGAGASAKLVQIYLKVQVLKMKI